MTRLLKSGIVEKFMKNNRDRLTLTFKKNIDPFLPKCLIQTKDDKKGDHTMKQLNTYMLLFV
ncbi:MAG: hypothetical protein VKL42_10965 [Snowella sp.]|nr:hypothetical protein [Snowella sp.]